MLLDLNELASLYPIDKLDKALKLLLNDVPDHQDDTINLKLLDSIDTLLSGESENKKRFLETFLYEFINSQILSNSTGAFFAKDSESVCFFLNLSNSLVKRSTSSEHSAQFLNRYFKFIQSYLSETDMSSIESSQLTSLIGFVCVCYDLIQDAPISSPSQSSIRDENKAVFTCLLDNYFLNEPSLSSFLNANQKSLFVRKAFKSLLNKHFLFSLQTNRFEEIERICLLMSQSMSFEMRSFTLDIYEEVLNDIFLLNTARLASKSKINSLGLILSTLKLNRNLVEFLPYVHPNTSKSFCFVLITDLLIGSLVHEHQTCFKSQFFVQLNQICDYFLSSQFRNVPNVFENVRFDGRFHVFFKCLADFYLVLNEFLQRPNEHLLVPNEQNESKIQMKEIQRKLFGYLLTPFKLSTKSNLILSPTQKEEEKKELYEELLDSLVENEQMRNSLLKQSLLSLKYLYSKSLPTPTLTEFVSIESFIYVLRSLNIKSDLKHVLLELLADFLNTQALSAEMNRRFFDHLVEMIKYKFENEKFSKKFYLLLEASLAHLSAEFINEMKLSTLINSSLQQMLTSNTKSSEIEIDSFNLHLNAIVDFLSNLVVKNENRHFELIVRLLSEQDFYLFDLLTRTCCLLFRDSEENQQMHGDTEILRSLIDSILKLLQSLYARLNSLAEQQSDVKRLTFYAFENRVQAEFVCSMEKHSLVESEAFMRREIVRFLMIFHSYSFKMWLACLNSAQADSEHHLSLDVVAEMNMKTSHSCHYFSYMLINDLDWQTQLYCLKYFADLIHSLCFSNFTFDFMANLSRNQTNESVAMKEHIFKHFYELNLAEVIFCYSDFFKALIKTLLNDFDQQTIQSSCKILLSMKTNERLMSFLQQLDQKNNQLFQKEIKSTYMPQMLQEIVQSNKEIAVGAYGSTDNNEADEDDNYFKMFLVSLDANTLNRKLIESSLTSDLYARNPVAILDDIINAYKFDMDQEKSVDCY